MITLNDLEREFRSSYVSLSRAAKSSSIGLICRIACDRLCEKIKNKMVERLSTKDYLRI